MTKRKEAAPENQKPPAADRAEPGNTSLLQAAATMVTMMSPGERRRLLLLLPAVTLMALLQVAGIASVMPFLALVANPDTIHANAILARVYDTLGFASSNAFLVFAGVAALVALVGSNAFTAFTEWLLLRFSWQLNHTLSVRMLREYLGKPYVFFLEQNTSGLAKNLLAEVRQAVSGFVVAGMQVVARGIVALFILALLIVVNPMLALLAFLFMGGTYGLVFQFVRRTLSDSGKRRSQADRERFRAADEALSGIKDIKVLGREDAFLEKYADPSRRYVRFMARQQVVSMIPRYAFETTVFGGMLLIVLFLLVRGAELQAILPTLGLYGIASYRLMPALQSIFSSMSQMRFSMNSVDLLRADLEAPDRVHAEEDDGFGRRGTGRRATAATRRAAARAPEPEDDVAGAFAPVEPLPFRESLELRGLRFTYPGAPHPVLQEFSLRVAPRSTVALVGTTGSGKTTTVDLILGLLAPDDGQLLVDGVPVTAANLRSWQRNVGYVPQFIYLADDSIANNIAFGIPSRRIDHAAVERAARLANIHDFIHEELPEGYGTRVGERGVRLSGGQRQRVGIARALYHDPNVLVLDEATSALDGVTEDSIFRAVSDLGKTKTIILIAHRMTTVSDCDRIYLLDRGRILASGRYQELLAASPEFRALAKQGTDSPAPRGTPS